MNTLYQRTKEIFDIAGNSVGWETKPVVFPDTFFLYSGLSFNWTDNTVTRNGKTYYLDKLVVNQEMNIPKTDEWLSHYGNDIQFEHYTGDASEVEHNPSGNTKNVKRAIYISSGITKYILEYYYNALDQVVKITSLAPQDSITSGDEQQQEEEIGEYTEQDLNSLYLTKGELIVTQQNTATLRGNGRCLFVTRRRTSNPLLSDAIQTDSDTGKISVSVTSPLYNVQVIGYTSNGDVVYVSTVAEVVPNTPRTFEIYNNYNDKIDYVGINLYYNDEESEIDIASVNQEDLGIAVSFTNTVNLVIRSEGSEDVTRHVLVGEQITLASLPTLSRSGYEFDGWSIGGNIVDDDFIITANTLVEAVWTRLYTLTKINDGAQTSQTYRNGTEITLETPTKAGHTFIGWYAEGSSVAQSTTFNISEDMTLTAQYSVNQYTLTLVVDGVETSDTYDYGTTVNLTTPEKENYNFVGWFAEGSETATASPLTITDNITLTAQFELIQYTVTLIIVDSEDITHEDAITCDAGYSLTEEEVAEYTASYSGTYYGCYTDSDMAFNHKVSLPYTVNDNVTLYVKKITNTL